MPFADYNELLQTIEDYSQRPDLVVQMRDAVFLCELRLQRDLRLRTEDASSSGTLTAGQDYLTLPTDCNEARFLRLDTDPIRWIDVVSPTRWHEYRRAAAVGSSSHPVVGLHQGLRIYLAPTPTSNDAYTLWYRSGVTHLSEDSPDNVTWLLTNAPDCLLYGSLWQLSLITEDEAGQARWQPVYADAVRSLSRAEWRAKLGGGGPLRTRPDVVPGGLPRAR